MPRRRANDGTPTRRSTNACERCKRRKIKCQIADDESKCTCVSCLKSGSICVYMVTPDGVPRGAEYVSALEAQITELQDSLRDSQVIIESLASSASRASDNFSTSPIQTRSEICSPAHESLAVVQAAVDDAAKNQHKVIEAPHDGITTFSYLLHQTAAAADSPGIPDQADALINTAYYYTQARYCLVDWARAFSWHEQRASLCYATESDDVDTQTAAFFVWVLYAIGAQLDHSTEGLSKGYFACASRYLPIVLSQQNLTAVQALLCLVQYYYRAPGGPSVWSLTGATMRLCIELGLHKKNTSTSDPYTTELRKRFFWATYCFDRLISIVSKRPFGIEDADIAAELPVNVDILCTDSDTIYQAVGSNEQTTSISFSLYHLSMYRLQSKIITYIARRQSSDSQFEEIQCLMEELEERRVESTRIDYPSDVPQQSRERVDAVYYLTALLLMRHLLMQPNIPSALLERCASLAADACKNQKNLCFNKETHHSTIRVYQCFRCGLTLLQCLALNPTVLPLRRSLRAINSCSSALAVYTGTLSIARPYLQIFENLSDHFLAYTDDRSLGNSSEGFAARLQEIVSCEPSEIPALLNTLSKSDDTGSFTPMPMDDSLTNFGLDLMPPFETLDDMLRPDIFQRDEVSLWQTPLTL